MQSVSSRIWTRVTVSISYDDINYTTGTSYRTRILLAMDWALKTRNDIDRFYVSRKEGRGRVNFENCVNETNQGLEEYTKKSKESLIAAATCDGNINRINFRKSRKTSKTRKQKWEEKTSVRILQATNSENYTRDDLVMAKQRKSQTVSILKQLKILP